ncbi:MAG TPA: Asp-tRNA(Asn)/Glu-tRNA(Gln) amidotransferase subunit GatC [Firmicutes bacterium]|nr:Asp-tRNA(Asn)/Glu-tRNA(Gln) amidotransferase subunit GatC [Bacillota bacterium]
MRITIADVDHVAMLARLAFSAEEKAEMAEQLSRIVGYIEKLNELDTEDVSPTAHAVPLRNVLRDDRVRPSLDIADALANAPDREGGYFKVPRILESE